MSNAAWLFSAVVWLSLVALGVVVALSRAPRRRKPVDELEATDAALRNRLVDLEDKFESYVKREAVRSMRARREEPSATEHAPVSREERKADLVRRWRAQQGGIPHGTAQ